MTARTNASAASVPDPLGEIPSFFAAMARIATGLTRVRDAAKLSFRLEFR